MTYKIYIIFLIIHPEHIVFEIELNAVYVNMDSLRIYAYPWLNGWILKVITETNKVTQEYVL